MGFVLVTVKFGKEDAAELEVLDCILPYDQTARSVRQTYGGLLMLETSLDPDAAARIIMNTPTSLVRTIVPVDAVVGASIKEIVEKSTPLVGDTAKAIAVKCVRRGRSIRSSRDVEEEVGKTLKLSGHSISLNSPDLVVRVDVIGEHATISVRNPDLAFKKT